MFDFPFSTPSQPHYLAGTASRARSHEGVHKCLPVKGRGHSSTACSLSPPPISLPRYRLTTALLQPTPFCPADGAFFSSAGKAQGRVSLLLLPPASTLCRLPRMTHLDPLPRLRSLSLPPPPRTSFAGWPLQGNGTAQLCAVPTSPQTEPNVLSSVACVSVCMCQCFFFFFLFFRKCCAVWQALV